MRPLGGRYSVCVCVGMGSVCVCGGGGGRVASICVQTCVLGGGVSDTRVHMIKRKLPHKTKCTFQSRDSID